jgi:rhodanese-related sulfurtransferase
VRILIVAALAVILAACLGVPTAKSSKPAAARDYSNPAQLAALLSERLEPYILVDVRTAAEYSTGHIPTAINIPYDEIAANTPTSDIAALVIVYCASGGRASKAATTLKGLGYTRVIDFGAIGKWQGPVRQGAVPGDCPCR